MDPISALRLPASPELRGAGWASPMPGVVGPKQISPAEIEGLAATPGLKPVAAPTEGTSFASVLANLVQDVSQKQATAGQAVNGLLTDRTVSLHQAMIAMEEASVSFQLMVEVRNKLVESYQELMRMQV